MGLGDKGYSTLPLMYCMVLGTLSLWALVSPSVHWEDVTKQIISDILVVASWDTHSYNHQVHSCPGSWPQQLEKIGLTWGQRMEGKLWSQGVEGTRRSGHPTGAFPQRCFPESFVCKTAEQSGTLKVSWIIPSLHKWGVMEHIQCHRPSQQQH